MIEQGPGLPSQCKRVGGVGESPSPTRAGTQGLNLPHLHLAPSRLEEGC